MSPTTELCGICTANLCDDHEFERAALQNWYLNKTSLYKM